MNPYTKRLEEPDYSQESEYTNIDSLYQSDVSEDVSDMESTMIDEFITNPKCENEKDGDSSFNDSMADSEIYTTYIVWK